MKQISIILAGVVLFFFALPSHSQLVPTVHKATYFDKTPPLRDMKAIPPAARDRSWKEGVIRNESFDKVPLENKKPLPEGADPVAQVQFGSRSLREPLVNFEGTPNLNSVYPPDTDGDIGPNHYVQMINLSFQVFDREGNSLYGPVDNSTLWDGFIGPWTGTNDGDPIILYDEVADRWMASQFAIETSDNTYWELIAISETGDPLGAWYRYAFQFPAFNDYPKLGVWPDAYYCTFNMFGDYRRVAAAAFERDAMLAGDPDARMVLFDLPQDSEPWSMLPCDFDGPPPAAGTPNFIIYSIDDAFNPGEDRLSIWSFSVDWDDPVNSTFEEILQLQTEPFDSRLCDATRQRCIDQPDLAPRLEAICDRLMYRLQYRNFGDYEVMVTNQTVDVDGFGHAGIRWYELRREFGGEWYIYQQGTYAPDLDHRWMGSIAMNGNGDIALGYSVSSSMTYPSIRYTGRTAESPLGEMTFYEETIINGSGVQTGSSSRWGDYSMMSVDPTDDSTFWFTTEYVEQTGSVRWQTRIAAFQLIEDLVAPAAVEDLAASPTTTNAIRLNWTATGNDGNEGTAFLYDIRYSTAPITSANFEDAAVAENLPDPSVAGTAEEALVAGLDYNTEYFFAMRVRDKQFNFSEISNFTSATTISPPQLLVEEDTIIQKIFPGSKGERSWVLSNLGEGEIRFTLTKDTIGTTENSGGEILGEYQNFPGAVSGMVWVDSLIYLVDMQEHSLYAYDTATQDISATFGIHNNPYGIVYDGELLWIGGKDGEIVAYTLDGQTEGSVVTLQFTGFVSLAWNGSNFLVNFILENDPVIFEIDKDGSILTRFYAEIENNYIWQAVWVPEHNSGHLWTTNNSGTIMQLDLAGDSAVIVKELEAPEPVSYAITHDGYDLFFGKIGGVLYRLEDGIAEVNWLKPSPTASVIPGSSDNPVSLHFDTERLEGNQHNANIKISSNDIMNPEWTIPVTLEITAGIDLGPDTSFCGDQVVQLDPGQGYASYLWSDGSTNSTLLADSNVFGTGVEDFWVKVTDIGGIAMTDSITLVFNDCAGILEFDDLLTVRIFPNPSKGKFILESEGKGGSYYLTIYTASGKTVHEGTGEANMRKTIDLTSAGSGVYIFRIEYLGEVRTQKVLVN